MTGALAVTAPERTEVAVPSPYRLWLAPDIARELGRHISPIVATVRQAFDERRQAQGAAGSNKLTIDMSDAATVPGAQLILLINLLRQALGSDVGITLSGVKPAITGALVTFDLPGDVVLIDARGRRWPG